MQNIFTECLLPAVYGAIPTLIQCLLLYEARRLMSLPLRHHQVPLFPFLNMPLFIPGMHQQVQAPISSRLGQWHSLLLAPFPTLVPSNLPSIMQTDPV